MNRNKSGIYCGYLGIISNLMIFILKIIIGILSNSISIMIDAFNNLADTVNSILTIIGFKICNKKVNKNYPYGYGKYEYLFGFIISIIMIILSISFIIESIKKIFVNNTLLINKISYIIIIFSLSIKIIQIIIYKIVNKKVKSNIISSIIIETKNDIITNILIIISMLFYTKMNIKLDAYLGLIVSIYIVNVNVKDCKEKIGFLVDKNEDKIIQQIKEKIMIYKEIINIKKIVINNYGPNKNVVYLDLVISKNIAVKSLIKLTKKIRKKLTCKEVYEVNIETTFI